MKSAPEIHLRDVQAVYSGPEGRLWELLMGEQIHIGGLQSSMDLADRAGIEVGQQGVDLCCASGAGMRFLVRFRQVARMTGVDATPAMLERGRRRCAEEGLVDRIAFVEANVCASDLPSGQSDFVWGEDAWCYVEDKRRLIAEAARLLKPTGVLAFTDWMEGPTAMEETEAQHLLRLMKFPSVLSLAEYCTLAETNGCAVRVAMDTERFTGHAALYLDMVEMQLTYDALKLLEFDLRQAEALTGEMRFLLSLARAGKLIQGLVIARKPA